MNPLLRALPAALLLACADKEEEEETGGVAPVDTAAEWCAAGPQLTWDNWAAGFFRNYCTSCHSTTSPNRAGAPEAFNFDTYEEVQKNATIIRSVVIDNPTMPIGGGVFEQDLEYLNIYLLCEFGA
jgi:uncharacterized membrane protein